jgi:pyruvate dehydrogenase E1 component
MSTTMAFVRIITPGARQDPRQARRAHRPDESRTFGMEGMFRQIGIYAPEGQLYTPQDTII